CRVVALVDIPSNAVANRELELKVVLLPTEPARFDVAGNAAAAANILVKPVFEYGYALGYQHFWLPNLRSTAVWGFAYTGYQTNLIGPTQGVVSNRILETAHFNLIWSPVAFIDAGVEFFWGQRQTASASIKGDEETLIGKFRVKF
ncbi:MAG: hypothetical protein WBX30_08520, partial [Stellaceae bacterium]